MINKREKILKKIDQMKLQHSSFKHTFYSTKEKVEKWLNNMDIFNYIINDDLSVDVKGNVYISNKDLYFIPVKFNIVNGDFKCSRNHLTSLKGCPDFVEGNFSAYLNQILTLEGSPNIVIGGFDVSHNYLTSLNFCPELVGSFFNIEENFIDKIDCMPTSKFNGYFSYNSLENQRYIDMKRMYEEAQIKDEHDFLNSLNLAPIARVKEKFKI